MTTRTVTPTPSGLADTATGELLTNGQGYLPGQKPTLRQELEWMTQAIQEEIDDIEERAAKVRQKADEKIASLNQRNELIRRAIERIDDAELNHKGS